MDSEGGVESGSERLIQLNLRQKQTAVLYVWFEFAASAFAASVKIKCQTRSGNLKKTKQNKFIAPEAEI